MPRKTNNPRRLYTGKYFTGDWVEGALDVTCNLEMDGVTFTRTATQDMLKELSELIDRDRLMRLGVIT